MNAAFVKAALAKVVKVDPFASFNFVMEIDGILNAGFTDVSGLTVSTDYETFHEGGFNDVQRLRLAATKYEPLVLKHGVTGLDGLWSWYEKTIAGKAERKNASVFVLDRSGMVPVLWWDITGAVPVKWEGPSLSADADSVAFESVTIAYEALTKSAASKAASAAASIVGAVSRVVG